jgi:hypothetical protein
MPGGIAGAGHLVGLHHRHVHAAVAAERDDRNGRVEAAERLGRPLIGARTTRPVTPWSSNRSAAARTAPASGSATLLRCTPGFAAEAARSTAERLADVPKVVQRVMTPITSERPVTRPGRPSWAGSAAR